MRLISRKFSGGAHKGRLLPIEAWYLYIACLIMLLRIRIDSARESKMVVSIMSGTLEQFLNDLSRGLDKTMVSINKDL